MKAVKNGKKIDSEFFYEIRDQLLTFIIEQGGAGKNKEYAKGVEFVLKYLDSKNVQITGIELERKNENTPRVERRVYIPEHPYPIDIRCSDIRKLRLAIGRSVAKHRREPGAKGGGNRQKRIRILTDVEAERSDFVCSDLSRNKISSNNGPLKYEIVPIENAYVSEYLVSDRSVEYAKREEQSLVTRFCIELKKKGFFPERGKYSVSGSTLYSDIFIESQNVLIEAKADASRESCRMAVGQLLDYTRFHNPRPKLVCLLGSEPISDMASYFSSVGIFVLWENPEGLFVGMDKIFANEH